MVFLLILIMMISPCRGWSIENYVDLKVADRKQSFKEDQLDSQRLISLFVQFQKQYLNFKFKEAQSSLKEIVEMKLLKDWNKEERKIFSTSYLRLAQMDELYRHQWIDSFLAFNESLFIDEDIFPPSFIQWIRDRSKGYQVSAHLWYGQNIPEGVKTVIINGESFNRLGFSRRVDPKMKYRVTLMKSEYGQDEKGHSIFNKDPYLVLVLSGEDLINYSFDTLDSKIKAEKVSFNPLFKNVKMDFNRVEDTKSKILPDKVLKYKSTNSLLSKKPLRRQVALENTAFDNKDMRLSSISMTQSLKDDIKKGDLKKSSGFFKKHKWFIIVFSGVVLGLVVSQGFRGSQKNRRQRVHHSEDIHY